MACAVFSPVWAEWRQARRTGESSRPRSVRLWSEPRPRRSPSPFALVAEHRPEAVDSLGQVVEASLDPLGVLRLVGGGGGVLKAPPSA